MSKRNRPVSPASPLNVLAMRPRRVDGLRLDYHPADPEIGGIEVHVWSGPTRTEGFAVHCADWGAVHRFILDLRRSNGGESLRKPNSKFDGVRP